MTGFTSVFYKADQRIHTQSTDYTVLSTALAPGNIGCVLEIRDVYLRASCRMLIKKSERYAALLMPVAGSVILQNMQGFLHDVESEQVLLAGQKAAEWIVENPFDRKINFLEVLLQSGPGMADEQIYSMKLPAYGHLCALPDGCAGEGCYISTAAYTGRTKAIYALHDRANSLVVYIINGAFEVEERLMEHRDALVLWDTPEVGFESLSEHAIILFIESPKKQA